MEVKGTKIPVISWDSLIALGSEKVLDSQLDSRTSAVSRQMMLQVLGHFPGFV